MNIRASHEKLCMFTMLWATLVLLAAPCMAMDEVWYFKQGTEYLEQGKLELAIEAFTRAIGEQGSNVEAYNNRALAYYEQGKFEQARSDFLTALEFDPDNEIANSNLGILLFETGQYDEAIIHLEKAVARVKEFSPHHAIIFRNLAFVYNNAGATEKAELAMQAALAIERRCLKDAKIARLCIKRQVSRHGVDHLLVLKMWHKNRGQTGELMGR